MFENCEVLSVLTIRYDTATKLTQSRQRFYFSFLLSRKSRTVAQRQQRFMKHFSASERNKKNRRGQTKSKSMKLRMIKSHTISEDLRTDSRLMSRFSVSLIPIKAPFSQATIDVREGVEIPCHIYRIELSNESFFDGVVCKIIIEPIDRSESMHTCFLASNSNVFGYKSNCDHSENDSA